MSQLVITRIELKGSVEVGARMESTYTVGHSCKSISIVNKDWVHIEPTSSLSTTSNEWTAVHVSHVKSYKFKVDDDKRPA